MLVFTRSIGLLFAHSQQNQQPVDIWQSALRRANEGYIKTKREGARMRMGEGDARDDGERDGVRVREREDNGRYSEAISRAGVL